MATWTNVRSEVGGLVRPGNEVSICLSIAWSSSLASNIDQQSWGFKEKRRFLINSPGVLKAAMDFGPTVQGFYRKTEIFDQ